MSVSIFVLDVEEFRPLVTNAQSMSGVEVLGPVNGYIKISSASFLEFNRKSLGFKPAVWYGALTGGMLGRVTEFGRDTLRVEAQLG